MLVNAEILSDLKKKYGKAFYLLDSVQFRSNFNELKTTFRRVYSNFNIAYSYKTNYIPKLCSIVNELDGYAEVVSEMELALALKVGVAYQKIIWNGPIKEPKIMEEFLLQGGTINMDSLEELSVLEELTDKHRDSIFNLGIRCNFDVRDGVMSRFGFDIEGEDFDEALKFVTTTPNVKLISLQCHFAKREVEYWPARAKGMVDLIKRIGIVPERIDLGGGLFGKMEDSLKGQFTSTIPEYEDYAKAAATIFADEFNNSENMPELIIEPGSALVGDCMKFVGTIKTVKNIRGKTIVTILGSQKNISMSGINPPIELFSMGKKQKKYEKANFVGFTCIESDILYTGYTGLLAVGDMIAISNCGSYSLVMKPPFILPNFTVIDISEGKIEIIKRTETFNDIFYTYNF